MHTPCTCHAHAMHMPCTRTMHMHTRAGELRLARLVMTLRSSRSADLATALLRLSSLMLEGPASAQTKAGVRSELLRLSFLEVAQRSRFLSDVRYAEAFTRLEGALIQIAISADADGGGGPSDDGRQGGSGECGN